MISAFIESMLGGLGRVLYSLYAANSLYINGFIILYGICVFFAHRSFNTIFTAIKKELKIEKRKKMGTEKLSTLLKKTMLPWDDLSHASWFPFIAIPGKIMIHFCSKSNLQKIFSMENLLVLLKEKEGNKADH